MGTQGAVDVAALDRTIADAGFSGVVRIDLPDGSVVERAAGLADRRWGVTMTVGTRLSLASVTKGFTALAVMSLVERGELALGTAARSLLGTDLPLVDEGVTVEHLLAHRSGIGDYLDESAITGVDDHVMTRPVHELDGTEAYVPMLDGHRQVSEPGAVFAYNNGGFVLLALLAERAAGQRFETLVDELVCAPAGLASTGFVRADALPPGVATGYLDADGFRTNSMHLPAMGSGDGGLVGTVGDLRQFWLALFAGRIVGLDTLADMTSSRSVVGERHRYGLGFWLPGDAGAVELEGYDAGVSCRTTHHPATGATITVISNTSDGAWPVLRALA
jgi:CubicO group peptidase (beta-lactamase class C family)